MGVSPGKIVIGSLVAAWVWRNMSPESKAGFVRFLQELSEATRSRVATSVNAKAEPDAWLANLKPFTNASNSGTIPAPPEPASLIDQRAIDALIAKLEITLPSSTAHRAQRLQVVDPETRWLDVAPHPSVILILGRRGSGKSALGYRLLESFRFRAVPYVVGAPAGARKLLPDWLGVVQKFEEVPPRAIALVDEAYLQHHARDSQSVRNKAISRLINLTRQKNQSILFVAQEARQVDRNIVSSADVIAFKEPASFQIEFERPQLRRIAERAKAEFEKLAGDKPRWAYVVAPGSDFSGMIPNSIPTFWSRSLSGIYGAGQGEGTERSSVPTRLGLGDRVAKARELRDRGWSYRQIARALGTSKASAVNYVRLSQP